MNKEVQSLEGRILAAKNDEGLAQLRHDILDLKAQGDATVATNYAKQRHLETIESLIKLVESKKNSLETSTFCFEGPPVKAKHDSVHTTVPKFEVKPFKQNIVSQKVKVSDHNGHLLLRQFDRCVVIDNKSSSVNIVGGLYSVVKIDIEGPVSLTGLDHCVVWVNCHQLRIHEVSNTLIISDISTTTIIEKCHDLRFAGQVKVDDFNFGFTDSVNYRYVPKPTPDSLAWVEGPFDSQKLDKTLEDLV